MLPIDQRLTESRDATVFVALDTIEPLTQHVRAILDGNGSPRTMTLLKRIRNAPGAEDLGFASTEIVTGLRVDEVAVIDDRDGGEGFAFRAHLTPAINSIGFSAYPNTNAVEREVANRYHATGTKKGEHPRRRSLTVVHLDAWPGHPSREDRIRIEYWNDYGVCTDTVVAFA